MGENEKTRPPRLVDALSVALRLISRPLQETLEREEDVSLDQWRALRSLSADEGRTMGELSERLQIPAASLTRIVDALVDRALVFRHGSAVDRRRVEVLLSDAGAALLVRLEDIALAHEAQYQATTGLAVDDLIAALTSVAGAPSGADPV
jgi:DNA-binding MarR family transcriptional regulator